MTLRTVSSVGILLAALAGAASAPPSQAALLALTRDGHFLGIDVATGVATLVGSIGRSDVQALERGADGVYFAVAEWNRLYAVDPANGRSTYIATLPYSFVADLARDPRGRRLYAAADADGAGDAELLVAIDPITGAYARIGAFEDPENEFDVPLQAFGLGFTAEARLFGSLFAVSPSDALVAAIDPASGRPLTGVPLPGIYSGLDVGADGVLYGIEEANAGPTSVSVAVAIDPASGAVTRISSEPLGLEAAVGDCANGVDDDADGALDGDDPGCQVWALDAGTSIPDCDDGEDDDADGMVDAADPGCAGAGDPSERALGLPCDNGLDDDGDGAIDATGSAGALADAQCGGSPLGRESAGSCGLGAELPLVFALLARRRTRQA
jgi:hypothetical protein